MHWNQTHHFLSCWGLLQPNKGRDNIQWKSRWLHPSIINYKGRVYKSCGQDGTRIAIIYEWHRVYWVYGSTALWSTSINATLLQVLYISLQGRKMEKKYDGLANLSQALYHSQCVQFFIITPFSEWSIIDHFPTLKDCQRCDHWSRNRWRHAVGHWPQAHNRKDGESLQLKPHHGPPHDLQDPVATGVQDPFHILFISTIWNDLHNQTSSEVRTKHADVELNSCTTASKKHTAQTNCQYHYPANLWVDFVTTWVRNCSELFSFFESFLFLLQQLCATTTTFLCAIVYLSTCISHAICDTLYMRTCVLKCAQKISKRLVVLLAV